MEQISKEKKSRFFQLLEFIRNYRIITPHIKRLSGIGDTLIGWGLIAINTVFFPMPATEIVLSGISFVLFFFAACLVFLLYALFMQILTGNLLVGFKDLLIKRGIKTGSAEIHLTTVQRRKWIYFRGFIAAGGYLAYNISKIYFGVIDNSAIFGADVLVYAFFAFLLLHERFNIKEIIGIIIASLGVLFVIFFDIESFNWKDGLISCTAGIISATAMTIIFFVTGIIVRHDSPKRVAFHQCVSGLILSIMVLLLAVSIKVINHTFNFPIIPLLLVKHSLVSGVLYAVALLFFLRAFLRTEPIVIAIVGYSLSIFVIVLEWLFHGELIDVRDSISAFSIGVGCFLLIHQEYVKDKKKSKEIKMQKPIYEVGLKEELFSLREKFRSGKLDKYTYLAEKHEFNKLLFEYSSEIKGSPIESIKISPDVLVFTFKSPFNIELEADGGARSAPFEILNFGSYEIEDEIIYNLIRDGDTILDIGAHIGWYAINFAKKFPNSHIYAFEPINFTFDFLNRNIKRNNISNITTSIYGCSNKEEEKDLYYFKSGSAIASIENLINHENVTKVKCILKPIDSLVNSLQINSVEFIKCDAEGSELYILQGSEQTIKKFHPIIFTELYEEWCQKCGYTSSDVLEMLKSWGYEAFQVIDGKLKEVKHLNFSDNDRYNYLFLNKKNHSKLIR